SWRQVSASYRFTCAIDVDDGLYCWGDNTFGQLGNGKTEGRQTSPVAIGTGHAWRQVSTGGSHVCALSTTGKAYCWGRNLSGQLGTGKEGGGSSRPAAVD